MFTEMSEAVAMVRPADSLAVPLGPGVPGGFLHALGERDDFTALEVFGALLPDLYQLFMRAGVRYRSGFFGPGERFLRDAGAAIDFVPADFRRFEPILRHYNPRIMATTGAMPVDGRVSLWYVFSFNLTVPTLTEDHGFYCCDVSADLPRSRSRTFESRYCTRTDCRSSRRPHSIPCPARGGCWACHLHFTSEFAKSVCDG